MDFLRGLFSQMWLGRMEDEVERQSVRGSIYALKAVLGSTRRLVLLTLYILLFLYSLFGALTVAVTAADLSLELKPLIIYTVLALLFGGVLFYNLREQTWIRRWRLDERIYALEERAEAKRVLAGAPSAEPPSQTQEIGELLERFEDRMERRLRDYERRQKIELGKAAAYVSKGRGGVTKSHQDMALY